MITIHTSLLPCEQFFRLGSKIDHFFLQVVNQIGFQISLIAIPVVRDEDGVPLDNTPLTFDIAQEYAEKLRIIQGIMSKAAKAPLESMLQRAGCVIQLANILESQIIHY